MTCQLSTSNNDATSSSVKDYSIYYTNGEPFKRTPSSLNNLKVFGMFWNAHYYTGMSIHTL